jgi:fatty acid desaturase
MEIQHQDFTKTLYRASPPLIKTAHLDEIPVALNAAIFAAATLVNLFQLLLAPLLIERPLWLAVALLPTLLIAPTAGVLVHEAIHGMLHPNVTINRRMGQLMAVFVGISYDMQRIDHLKHHKWSRTAADCDEVYVAPKTDPRKVVRYYYAKLLGAFWPDFFLTNLVCFLPRKAILVVMGVLYMRPLAADGGAPLAVLVRTNKLPALRAEGALSLLLLAGGAFPYREHLWLFAALIFARALILTVLDSFAHYDTPLNDTAFAKNVRMPVWLERGCMLNFNYHGVHHIFPTTPWVYLPRRMHYFAPQFYFIQHGGLLSALRKKYSPPRAIAQFPANTGRVD